MRVTDYPGFLSRLERACDAENILFTGDVRYGMAEINAAFMLCIERGVSARWLITGQGQKIFTSTHTGLLVGFVLDDFIPFSDN